jgi:hypothetical protein
MFMYNNQCHIYNNNSKGSRAARARALAALFAVMLAMGLGLMPAEAAPFACVTNDDSNSVSVIDTATNTVSRVEHGVISVLHISIEATTDRRKFKLVGRNERAKNGQIHIIA